MLEMEQMPKEQNGEGHVALEMEHNYQINKPKNSFTTHIRAILETLY